MAQLNFIISNQVIRRTDDFYVVADSYDYLRAHFDFTTSEWDGIEKTALFSRSGGQAYEMLIDQTGDCVVPHEVLAGAGLVTVSVFGGSLITVNTATVEIAKSGYRTDAESSTDPTPGIYEQILSHLQELENIAEQVGDAEQAAINAAASEQSAALSAEAADLSARTAVSNATAAAASASAAAISESNALESATTAQQSADRAEQAAGNAGFMFMEIIDGHLIYERTDQVDVDFNLDDGHLIMEGV